MSTDGEDAGTAPPTVPTAKASLRARLRATRRGRSEEQLAAAAVDLADRMDELCGATGARTVACYLSRADEPPTRLFLERARAAGITVLLPHSHDDGRLGWGVDEGVETVDARAMPAPTRIDLPAGALGQVDLALIPATAVARDGTRLGRGAGYFDRALAGLARRPPVYAVVFDDELVESLPREAHDIPVDGAVTPSGITVF